MIRTMICLCLLFVTAQRLFASSPPSVYLEDLTWIELRDAVKAGTKTVIIPVGGTEQNGPYIALGKHNVRVMALAGKIAAALGHVLVAPVVAYVPEGSITPPTEHMCFPGTITVSDEVFEGVLESAARSFKLHGFTDIVLIGDHGGYQKDLGIVAARLNADWSKTPVRAHFIPEYYTSSLSAFASELIAHGARPSEIGTHAGLADTSLMLALDPKLVRKERLGVETTVSGADGIYGGDPSRSSVEFGQLGVDIIVANTVEAIRKATTRH